MSRTDWVSITEACELTAYKPKYLRRVLQSGKIKAEKKGGHDWWIDKKSLLAYKKAMDDLGDTKFVRHDYAPTKK